MKKLFGALLALVSSVVFATTLVPIQLINPAGSSSGQAIVSTGASSAPEWGGIGLNGIASIAANTVIANATASSAAPTAFAMPSCSTSASALNWTTSTGFTCNMAVNAATLGGQTFASPPAAGVGSSTAVPMFATKLSASTNGKMFATKTSAQAVAASTNTTLTSWNAATFDSTGAFNTSTGVYTCPDTGIYLVSAQIEYASGAAATFAASVVVNGSTVATGVTQYTTAATPSIAQVTAAVQCTASQTIVLQAFQSSAGSINTSTTAGQLYLSIVRIP